MTVQVDLHARCVTCGHSFSFHGKTVGGACRAMGCKGEDGHRCEAFVGHPVEAPANPSKG